MSARRKRDRGDERDRDEREEGEVRGGEIGGGRGMRERGGGRERGR